MIKIYVIAPDKASGYAFCDVMKSHGIDAEFNYHVIRPRVLNNKITTSHDVIDDMNSIFSSFSDKTKSVVIACNTLQLWLPDVDPKYKQHVKIYTTFEACQWKFKHLKVKPVWLGTTPLVERTTDFPTLITLGRPEVQDLVQELIWRIKMIEGDEFGTAPDSVKKDQDNVELQKLKINRIKNEIVECLKELRVKNVILGCTELPLVLKDGEIPNINFVDPATALAEYVKSQSVSVVFAGGTISSLANSEGVRSGGQVFDLLERLNVHAPGAYKNLNVTKSEIVYSGLSENMSIQDQENIANTVNTILDNGISRIVITHGTDAMEQTARYLYTHLQDKLVATNTVIALTGSNDHAGSSKTDAWHNLSLAISEESGYIESGVYVAFHGHFVPAKDVVKKFYEGGSMSYISKGSPVYKENKINFDTKVAAINKELTTKFSTDLETDSVLDYDVNVIREDHHKFLAEVETKKPKAVVFKLYHSGTANTTSPTASVSLLVRNLTDMGIVCFGATETGEPTDLHLYESSISLLKAGMVPLYDMFYLVALHKLQLLGLEKNNLNRGQIISQMLTNFIGEINETLIKKDDVDKLSRM